MKKFVRKVTEYADLYRDDKTGIASIEDGNTGLAYSVHPNIDRSGSVAVMRNLGYWGREDRAVRSFGWIYNIDRFVCDPKNPLEAIAAKECRCQGCLERRMRLEEGRRLSGVRT